MTALELARIILNREGAATPGYVSNRVALSRAVLEQHAEIERLRPLAMSADEALELEGESDVDHRAVARRLAAEIDRLKAGIADAANILDAADYDDAIVTVGSVAASLRKLVRP